MGRTANILGRVVRNLRKHDPVNYVPANVTEIYDEMAKAQDQIIALCQFDKEIEILLITGQEDYSLTVSTRNIIGSIKTIITPDDWNYPIEIVDNAEWDNIVNGSYSITQPLYATIFTHKLLLHPVPTSGHNGDILKVWAYLNASLTIIGASVEPEIPDYWDDAIEYYTTSKFLIGPDRERFYGMFVNQVRELGHLVQKKHHKLKVKGTW